jgi:hypothetical protein
MSGGNYELAGGFWVVSQVCPCIGDVNGDGKRDGVDVQKFVDCLVAGEGCSCADVDAINGVTFDDVVVFVSDLLAGITCP